MTTFAQVGGVNAWTISLKQVIFRSRLGMALGPNQTKCHRQPKHVPTDDEQGKANTEKPRIMFTFAAFLSQWILLGPLGLVAAIDLSESGPHLRVAAKPISPDEPTSR